MTEDYRPVEYRVVDCYGDLVCADWENVETAVEFAKVRDELTPDYAPHHVEFRHVGDWADIY